MIRTCYSFEAVALRNSCGLILLFVQICTASCASENSGSSPSDAPSQNEPGPECDDPTPPPHIDVTTCRQFTSTGPGDGSALDECFECCQDAGFSTATFLNQGRCTCGRAPEDGRDTVCSAPEAVASGDACSSCCHEAEFGGSAWFGATAPNLGSCGCNSPRNDEICAATLSATDPSSACECCCLQNGFVSALTPALLAPQCRCLGT